MTDTGNDLDDRLLTASGAALYLGYAEGTIRNKAAAGEIPSVKLGTALRFRLSELDAWIAKQNEQARSPAPAEATP
ncbi:MAG: helix-turn-helix domain-containing protein [Gemmatimonadota bacterium]